MPSVTISEEFSTSLPPSEGFAMKELVIEMSFTNSLLGGVAAVGQDGELNPNGVTRANGEPRAAPGHSRWRSTRCPRGRTRGGYLPARAGSPGECWSDIGLAGAPGNAHIHGGGRGTVRAQSHAREI